jgi:precorrin-6A/cobalt-precorrin-6A reductase
MRRHRIEALIAKNSGGHSTYAKIAAARRLGFPVVMIRRPEAPAGETVETVDQALAWIAFRAGRGKSS